MKITNSQVVCPEFDWLSTDDIESAGRLWNGMIFTTKKMSTSEFVA